MTRAVLMAVIALTAAFGVGWQASGWHRDSLQLAINQAAQQAGEHSRQAFETLASQSARQLEGKLDALQDAKPKEIRTEVVKPVFTNVCVSDDFVRMYNTTADKAARTLSGKSLGEMPGNAAPH